MRTFEKDLAKRGFKCVVGIDEAGRGPLAGPVVAAAVQIIPEKFVSLIDDSKRLSPKKRDQAYEEILRSCLVGIGQASVWEIDQLNILQATFLAMNRAVENFPGVIDFCLIDGSLEVPNLGLEQEAIIKGDSLSISIAAASIVAKVERDLLMLEYDKMYPGYNFAKNKGYGTQEHRSALEIHGRSPIHRTSFKVASL